MAGKKDKIAGEAEYIQPGLVDVIDKQFLVDYANGLSKPEPTLPADRYEYRWAQSNSLNALNELGLEGWEVIQIDGRSALMKRRF